MNSEMFQQAMSPAALLTLASRINAAHREARAYAAQAVERALEAGDLLLSVKATLAHGQWLPWLAEHCPDVSARTAQGYMKIARELPPEMRTDAHLSLNGAKRLLAAPKEETPDPDAALEDWLSTAPLCDGMYTETAYLLDAAGWPEERIAAAFATNASRYGLEHSPQAEGIAAWLNPKLTERPTCCTRRDTRDPQAAYPKGADAEDLYRAAVRYWLALFQKTHTKRAAWRAGLLDREDLAASLRGSLKVIERTMVGKPPEPTSLLELAAHTAAYVDAFHVWTDTVPDDAWILPVGMWSAFCLRIATEEEGILWDAARALSPKQVTPDMVEKMKLYQAAIVYMNYIFTDPTEAVAIYASGKVEMEGGHIYG